MCLGSRFRAMLGLASWTIPVIREILTRWDQQDLRGETLISDHSDHTLGHTQMATEEKAS